MKRFANNWLRFIAFIFLIFICNAPSTGHADVHYRFIKIACDRATQSALVTAFSEYNETGAKLSKSPGKNTYYLNEISEKKKKISCHLGKNKTVSFRGYYSDSHPGRDDTVITKFNEKQVYVNGGLLKLISLKITAARPNDYTFTHCWRDNPELRDGEYVEDEWCETKHVLNDKIIEESDKIPYKK